MVRSILVAAVTASCLVACSQAALDMNQPFTVDVAGCNQIGVAPAGLTSELPAGYDYTCYTEQKYVKRWASTDGIPSTMLAMGSTTLMSDAQTYMMGSPLATIVPFFAFGLIATIACGIWSCGMCSCCAATADRAACCCGKCCSKPPAFTKGVGGWIMIIFTLGTGVAVVVLCLSGIAATNDMDEALTSVGGSFSILESWTNSTSEKLGVSVAETEKLVATVGTLPATIAAMQTDEIKAELTNQVAGIPAIVQGALDGLVEVQGQMTDLEGSVNGLGDSMSGSIESVNGYRQTGMFTAWLVLVIFMAFEILVALVRKLAPEKTGHCLCGTLFGIVTFFYVVVMFIVFLVTAIVAIVTMIIADVCVDPDSLFNTVLGAADVGVDTSALVPDLRARRADDDGGDAGANLFGYFLTCDTQNGVTNPFNEAAATVLDALGDATSQFDAVDAYFVDFEASAAYTLLQTRPTDEANYLTDKANLQTAIAAIKTDVGDLGISLSGEADSSAIDWSDNGGQGLTNGTLSALNCYQVNARYQAVINLVCTYTFSTLAQSCEYFMAAAILMALIQWAKRWSRPFPADTGGDEYVDNKDDKDFADNGGDPMVSTLNSL